MNTLKAIIDEMESQPLSRTEVNQLVKLRDQLINWYTVHKLQGWQDACRYQSEKIQEILRT